MQDLLVVKNGRVIVQANSYVYDDTLVNFITDGGEKLPDGVERIDYNKDDKRCWINGKAFHDFPNEYAENVLGLIGYLISNKKKRELEKREREEAERIANMTEEEKAALRIAQAKADRADAVSKIIVEVDGMKFDGDEESQTRMGRSIVAMNDDETITWVLHDDKIAQVSKAQLKEVLRKAGQKQTELWTVPYL